MRYPNSSQGQPHTMLFDIFLKIKELDRKIVSHKVSVLIRTQDYVEVDVVIFMKVNQLGDISEVYGSTKFLLFIQCEPNFCQFRFSFCRKFVISRNTICFRCRSRNFAKDFFLGISYLTTELLIMIELPNYFDLPSDNSEASWSLAECLSLWALRTIRVVSYVLSAKNHELGYSSIINNSVNLTHYFYWSYIYNIFLVSNLKTSKNSLYYCGLSKIFYAFMLWWIRDYTWIVCFRISTKSFLR